MEQEVRSSSVGLVAPLRGTSFSPWREQMEERCRWGAWRQPLPFHSDGTAAEAEPGPVAGVARG